MSKTSCCRQPCSLLFKTLHFTMVGLVHMSSQLLHRRNTAECLQLLSLAAQIAKRTVDHT